MNVGGKKLPNVANGYLLLDLTLHSAEAVAESICDVGRQSCHEKVCGYSELKRARIAESGKRHRREHSSTSRLVSPGM
jgi:hypothetical protein